MTCRRAGVPGNRAPDRRRLVQVRSRRRGALRELLRAAAAYAAGGRQALLAMSKTEAAAANCWQMK